MHICSIGQNTMFQSLNKNELLTSGYLLKSAISEKCITMVTTMIFTKVYNYIIYIYKRIDG